MKLISLLLVFLLSAQLFADTDPHFETQGYTLIQDSWIFSPEKTKITRDKLIDLDTALKTNESYKTSLDLQVQMSVLQEKKVNLVLEQNDQLAKSLQSERTINGWEKFGYFALGIAAAVLGGWAIGQAHK